MHNEEVVLHLRRLAFVEARCVHLAEDDAHDCSMEMVLHALMQFAGYAACQLTEGPEGVDPALLSVVSVSVLVTHPILRSDLRPEQTVRWLRRCARNFALNYRRRIDTRREHEVTSGSLTPENDTEADSNSVPIMSVPSAETDALDKLLRLDVYAAVHQLPPGIRDMFARFYLHSDSLAEIAYSSGKSQEAVKKSIHRMRRHVRVTLAGQGYDSND